MMVGLLPVFGLLASFAAATPTTSLDERQLPWFGTPAPPLPTVTLPYGTWQANSYDKDNDLYVFKNIRFAAPPVGDLRFSKPAPPLPVQGIQNGSIGHGCLTAPEGISGALGIFKGIGEAVLGANTDEDCLFLDVFVPAKAMNGTVKNLPVVSWFYGGAYTIGSKDGVPNYGGVPIVRAAQGGLIYVVSNYRLGPYGFLGGPIMEKEGTPNAAFYDQRAALKWIQDYIGLFGGDKKTVSAWGESAGAGSLLHHLVAFGGTQDPLFRRALLQSPAYEPAPDRSGTTEDKFNIMLRETGCTGQGLACLRKASADQINKAATQVIRNAPNSTFGFGPLTDGQWVRQFPSLELVSGNYWKDMDSVMISHTTAEADIFAPGLNNETDFARWIDSLYPEVDFLGPKIKEKYGAFTDIRNRTVKFVADSTFLCNILPLTRAYKGKAYNMQFSRGTGLHGTDIIADFYGPGLGDVLGLINPGDGMYGDFAMTYQRYLISHAITGNPNSLANTMNRVPAVQWPMVQENPTSFSKVLDAGVKGFSLVTDNYIDFDYCSWWIEFAKFFTNELGLAPPGASMPSTLTGGTVVAGSPQASRNYGAGANGTLFFA